MTTSSAVESRFAFGRNWQRYARVITDDRVRMAEESLSVRLDRSNLDGCSFLDVGCGSGLFSLAARNLGAAVRAFDYDADAVRTSVDLKRLHRPLDPAWSIERGSVLDDDYMRSLGTFDVVYSWGVLHHTGDQWRALRNVAACVKPGGTLFIALYNDQAWMSRYWTGVKRLYNQYPWLRPGVVTVHAPYLLGGRFAVRAVTLRLRVERGMTLWYDMLDWLGGYPFEVSKPEQVLAFCGDLGFAPRHVKAVGRRSGCNEYVLSRT